MTLETSRLCEYCAESYRPQRANQVKYCSKKCRRAAMRQRKAQEATINPVAVESIEVAAARALIKVREDAVDFAATQRPDLTDDEGEALVLALLEKVSEAQVYLLSLGVNE